jgi:hypothetical protein
MRHNSQPVAGRVVIEQRKAVKSNVTDGRDREFAAARNKRDELTQRVDVTLGY